MTCSKLILSLMFLGLAACSTQSNKNKDSNTQGQSNFDQAPGTNFLVDALKVSSTTVAAFSSYGLPTKKTFNLQACIKDPLNSAIQVDLPFGISDGMGGEVIKRTDVYGCLNWAESHDFSYLSNETYFKFKRTISGKGIYKGEVYVQVALNPWADGPAAALDLRYNELPASAKVKEIGSLSVKGAKIASTEANLRVNLKSAAFYFTGLDYPKYEITPFLGLKVAHRYSIKLTPTVIRQTLNKAVVPESFNAGRMRVIVVILREDQNPSTQFTADNIVTQIEWVGDLAKSPGDLVADVSIPFDNVSDILSRTKALVSLIPMDDLDGLPEMNFVGPMKPGLLDKLELFPTDQSGRRLVGDFNVLQAKRDQVRGGLKPTDLFIRDSGYSPMEMSSVEIYNSQTLFGGRNLVHPQLISEQYLAAPSNRTIPSDLMKLMCHKLFGSQDETRGVLFSCLQFPNIYMNVVKRSIVDSLNSKLPVYIKDSTDVYKFKQAASITRSDTTTMSTGLSLKASLLTPALTLGTPDFGAKFSFGADWSLGRVFKSESATSINTSREREITAESNSFRIDANVKRCLIVSLSELGLRATKTANPNFSGIFYCTKAQREQRVETFYQLQQKIGMDGSGYTDPADRNSSAWRMFIRGKATLNLFESLLKQNFMEFRVSRWSDSDYVKTFKEYYTSQEFPGILSEP